MDGICDKTLGNGGFSSGVELRLREMGKKLGVEKGAPT